jgi:hypothetical protein
MLLGRRSYADTSGLMICVNEIHNRNAEESFARLDVGAHTDHHAAIKDIRGGHEMRCVPKSPLLSLAFLTGVAVAAHAQSVANLPPAGTAPAAQPPAYSAPTATGPNPGNNVSIPSAPTFQKPADWDGNRNAHPYSTSGVGPNPGVNVIANNEPSKPQGGQTPAEHPYSQSGTGPQPGLNVAIPNSH